MRSAAPNTYPRPCPVTSGLGRKVHEQMFVADRESQAASTSLDDMSRTVPRNRDSHDDMSSAVAELEDRVEAIERELAACAPLVAERQRLLEARAAILGEPVRSASVFAHRVTREDVAGVLHAKPGSTAGQIARALGVNQPAISAHRHRGKGERFVNRGRRWYPAI